MGIHYDYKSTKGNKLMEKQAKREKKLAEKKAKRLAKEGPKNNEVQSKTLDTSKPLTLEPNSFSSFTNGTLRNVHQLKRKREMAEIISRLF